jgi:hypothetical protein
MSRHEADAAALESSSIELNDWRNQVTTKYDTVKTHAESPGLARPHRIERQGQGFTRSAIRLIRSDRIRARGHNRLPARRIENVMIERVTDLSYRAVGAVCSARC